MLLFSPSSSHTAMKLPRLLLLLDSHSVKNAFTSKNFPEGLPAKAVLYISQQNIQVQALNLECKPCDQSHSPGHQPVILLNICSGRSSTFLMLYFLILISSGYIENRHEIKAMCIHYKQSSRERKFHEKPKDLRQTGSNCMEGFQQGLFRKSWSTRDKENVIQA